MKYTMTDGSGKIVNIPDEYIDRNMKALDIDRQFAIELYLADELIVPNDEALEMSAKAKTAGAGCKAGVGPTAKRKAPERKPDDTKRDMIAKLAESVRDRITGTMPEITNIERMIAFSYDGDQYEITLTKKRPAKK